MGKAQKPAAAAAERVTEVREAHRRVVSADVEKGRAMAAAGLALVVAVDAGAVSFDRMTKSEAERFRGAGGMTRQDLASHLNCSPTLLSKYLTLGRLQGIGVTPDKDAADWARITEDAAAKYITEPLNSKGTPAQRAARVRAALAAKRAGQATRKPSTAKPKKSDTTPLLSGRTIEAEVTRVTAWLAKNGASLSGEKARTIVASLREAANAVEAAQHEKAAARKSA